MFEIPECVNLARQMNSALTGKIIEQGRLGNSPHKFVWYNRTPEEFTALTSNKRIGEIRTKGRWIFISLEPGFVLLLGECGGKVLFHTPGSKLPKKYHLHLTFEDESFFTVTTQMWGAMELFEAGAEQDRDYVKDMKPTPIDPEFTFGYFDDLINYLLEGKKRSVKSLTTQDQLIPGLGNAIAQDIHYKAKLHPKKAIADLSQEQRRELHMAIINTVQEAIDKGGRYDETDLYGHKGGYIRLMDKNSAGQPCSICGTTIEKIQYLGGACYLCPSCQAL